MRNLILVLSILGLLGCNPREHYQIVGQVPISTTGTVRLSQYGESRLDSKVDTIKNGKFSFEGEIPTPEQFIIIYEKDGPTRNYQSFSFMIEPNADVEIILYPDSITESIISGSKISDEFSLIEKTIEDSFRTSTPELMAQYQVAAKNGDKEILSVIEGKMNSITRDIQEFKLNYLESNPKSHVSLYLLNSLYLHADTDTTSKYFKMLNSSLSNSKYFQRIESFLSLLPGNPYIDFELTNGKGNTYSLSEIAENKIVLIDFWSSWCSPCREQNKELARLYEKYKSKDFEIVGVSIDRDTTAFFNTISEDTMTWINLIDRTDYSSVKNIYQTANIPSNVLIDKHGIIRYRDIEIGELEDIIEKLLKQ